MEMDFNFRLRFFLSPACHANWYDKILTALTLFKFLKITSVTGFLCKLGAKIKNKEREAEGNDFLYGCENILTKFIMGYFQ